MVMDLRDPPTTEDNNWEMVDDVLHRNEASLRLSLSFMKASRQYRVFFCCLGG